MFFFIYFVLDKRAGLSPVYWKYGVAATSWSKLMVMVLVAGSPTPGGPWVPGAPPGTPPGTPGGPWAAGGWPNVWVG